LTPGAVRLRSTLLAGKKQCRMVVALVSSPRVEQRAVVVVSALFEALGEVRRDE
jgi:hypothetical protein